MLIGLPNWFQWVCAGRCELRNLLSGVAVVCVVLGVISKAFACVGARPLSMGGAFTGLADDAYAVYWNPAALYQIEKPQLTYTGNIYDRDTVNYDDFVAFVHPLLEDSSGDWGTIGFSIVSNKDKATAEFDSWLTLNAEDTEKWFVISYGREFFEGLALGVNLRYIEEDLKLRAEATLDGTTYTAEAKDSDTSWGADLAIYYAYPPMFTFGLLVQDVNEPEVEFFEIKGQYNRNFRPGLVFKPDDMTSLSFELYDATDTRDIRLGIERWITENFAVRAGGYNVNNPDNRACTAGLGYKFEPLVLFPAVLEIDYCIMYWTDPPADVSETTHMISAIIKF